MSYAIEFDEKDAKVALIEHLQNKLSQRNKRIEELQEKLKAGEGSHYAKKQYDLGYKRGWIECSSKLMETTRKAAWELSKVRQEAFEEYLAGDRLLVDGQRVGGDI